MQEKAQQEYKKSQEEHQARKFLQEVRVDIKKNCHKVFYVLLWFWILVEASVPLLWVIERHCWLSEVPHILIGTFDFFFCLFFNNPISWIGKSVEYVGLLVLNFTAIFASLRVFFFRFPIELLRALLVFSVPFKTGRTNCKTQEDWQSRFYIITQCGYTWYIGTQQRHFCCGCW